MYDLSGRATRVGDLELSRMVNLSYEEKENDKNMKNYKDLYFGYLRNDPEYIRSNMNVGRNTMMMDARRESMMNWPLKQNCKTGYFSDIFLQRRQPFHDKKNKGTFFIYFSLLFHITHFSITKVLIFIH